MYGSIKQIGVEGSHKSILSKKKKIQKSKDFFCLGDVVTMSYGILLHKRAKKYLKLYTDVSVSVAVIFKFLHQLTYCTNII